MMLLHESIKYVSEFQWTDATEGVLSSYNSVSEEQRNILTSQGNASFDWSNVFIINSADLRTLSRIRRCNFDGIIYISNFIGEVVGSDGFVMQSGLYDSCFGGKCFLSDSCRISTTSFVGNTFVGLGAGIINCGSITCRDFIQGSTEHLNDKLNIDVGPETGGRKVVTSVGVTFLTICKQLFRDTDLAGECNLQHSYQSRFTIIGDQSFLMGCDQVHNSLLGPRCKVSSSSLRDCILCSVPSSPISISAGARLTHCILNEACSASNNCLVDHVYFCENSSIGDCARVAHSVLGPDSSVAGGECHHSLLGPFVGFHHQSLLIATIWPQGRGNIAYDAKVGANHTGRVSDQECWPGEGIFFGLGSAIKFPSNLLHSPYSIVASGTLLSPQRITYPFSLISSLDRPLSFRGSSIAPTACTVCPGWVILSNPYMIDRASMKFASRRKAKYHRTDYPILRPWIIDTVLTARNTLVSSKNNFTQFQLRGPLETYCESEVPGLGSCLLAVADLEKGIKAYSIFLKRYALHGLLYLMLTVTDNLLNAMQLLSENLKSPSPAINVTSSSGESVWGGLEEDILSLAVPTDTNGKSSRHADLVATESYDPTVMRHQLLILRGEYPAIDLDEALYSWVDELLVKSSHQCGRTVQLMLLLEDLGDLESSHATAVGACRSRDGTKGRSIIPDYDIVNAAGSDVLSDPVVRGSMERSIRIADAVSKLRDLRT